ncbi:MAG TPA: dihydrolipoamide succinyltransferase, partial [Alphaproteobacteria bacterium]|nr:dihydrolipoamide succinyltransferase [Alphaproteobacteria bacterium]
LETDKVTLDVPAPANGALLKLAVQEGETVEVGALLASFEEGKGAGAARPAAKAQVQEREPVAAVAAAGAGGARPTRPAAAPVALHGAESPSLGSRG